MKNILKLLLIVGVWLNIIQIKSKVSAFSTQTTERNQASNSTTISFASLISLTNNETSLSNSTDKAVDLNDEIDAFSSVQASPTLPITTSLSSKAIARISTTSLISTNDNETISTDQVSDSNIYNGSVLTNSSSLTKNYVFEVLNSVQALSSETSTIIPTTKITNTTDDVVLLNLSSVFNINFFTSTSKQTEQTTVLMTTNVTSKTNRTTGLIHSNIQNVLSSKADLNSRESFLKSLASVLVFYLFKFYSI